MSPEIAGRRWIESQAARPLSASSCMSQVVGLRSPTLEPVGSTLSWQPCASQRVEASLQPREHVN